MTFKIEDNKTSKGKGVFTGWFGAVGNSKFLNHVTFTCHFFGFKNASDEGFIEATVKVSGNVKIDLNTMRGDLEKAIAISDFDERLTVDEAALVRRRMANEIGNELPALKKAIYDKAVAVFNKAKYAEKLEIVKGFEDDGVKFIGATSIPDYIQNPNPGLSATFEYKGVEFKVRISELGHAKFLSPETNRYTSHIGVAVDAHKDIIDSAIAGAEADELEEAALKEALDLVSERMLSSKVVLSRKKLTKHRSGFYVHGHCPLMDEMQQISVGYRPDQKIYTIDSIRLTKEAFINAIIGLHEILFTEC